MKKNSHVTSGRSSTYSAYFYIFISVVTILRLFFIASIDISPDEAYYWNWSRHLDFSYYDHPPMVAYIIYLTTFFNTYNGEFFIRLGSVLMGGGMSLISFFMARDVFKSDAAGFWAGVWSNITLLFSLGAVIITPDTPQAFFGLLFLYLLYRALFCSYTYGFFFAGLCLGFALLSKYTSFLFMPCVILFFLLSKEKRKYLWDKRVYGMLILSLVLFAPVILWNMKYNWISFSFQLSHGFGGNFSDILDHLPEFVGTQVLLLTPFIFIGIILTLVYSGKQGTQMNDDRMLFLFCTSAPVVIFFLLVSMKSKIEGNWPAFGYMTAVVALGGLTVTYKKIDISPKKMKLLTQLKWTSFSTAAIILVAVHLLALFPPTLLLKKTSLTRRLMGWNELGKKISLVMKEMDEENTFIFGNRHQVISEVSFYTDKQYETYQIGGYGRYPYLTDMSHLQGKNAIYVTELGRSEYKRIQKFFNTVEEVEPLHVMINGENVRGFQVYKCYNYKGGLINV